MNLLIMMLGGAAGAGLTFFLQSQGLSRVLASSLVGLLATGVGYLVSDAELAPVVFAGSFVGMTSLTLAPWWAVTCAGAVSGTLYLAMVKFNVFPGYGGRLGSIAFIACLLAYKLLGKG